MWLISPSAPTDIFKGSSNQLSFFFFYLKVIGRCFLSALSQMNVNHRRESNSQDVGTIPPDAAGFTLGCVGLFRFYKLETKKGQDADEASERPGAV